MVKRRNNLDRLMDIRKSNKPILTKEEEARVRELHCDICNRKIGNKQNFLIKCRMLDEEGKMIFQEDNPKTMVLMNVVHEKCEREWLESFHWECLYCERDYSTDEIVIVDDKKICPYCSRKLIDRHLPGEEYIEEHEKWINEENKFIEYLDSIDDELDNERFGEQNETKSSI